LAVLVVLATLATLWFGRRGSRPQRTG